MRSRWKHPFFLLSANAQLRRTAHLGRHHTLRLRHRRLRLDESMVGRFFALPTGRGRQRLGIGPLLVGHRIGEFSPTKKRVVHFAKKRAKARERKLKEEAKAARAKAAAAGANPPRKGQKL